MVIRLSLLGIMYFLSSVIKEGGETILAQFASIISGVSSSVKEIEVLGHTTQADPNVPNDATGDRVLSAERAARVAAYLQERTNVSPANIVGVGYGQRSHLLIRRRTGQRIEE